ncbi:MAG: hypothetical protein IJ824_01230 [Alphaproteobacteria bacterium]|nr:hypothetical protein [Alphaproteobacteria bacterium]
MKNFFKNVLTRLSWQPNLLTEIEAALLIALWPLMHYADASWFVEDGVVENLQLLVCFACLFVTWFTPKDKYLFRFLALVTLLIICREINAGRHWLCAYYNLSYDCKWPAVPFGLVLKWARNLLVVATVIYFLWHKVYRQIWQYAVSAPIYVWEFLFLSAGIILALLAEKPLDNETMEEVAESLFYVALLNCFWRYGYGKNKH